MNYRDSIAIVCQLSWYYCDSVVASDSHPYCQALKFRNCKHVNCKFVTNCSTTSTTKVLWLLEVCPEAWYHLCICKVLLFSNCMCVYECSFWLFHRQSFPNGLKWRVFQLLWSWILRPVKLWHGKQEKMSCRIHRAKIFHGNLSHWSSYCLDQPSGEKILYHWISQPRGSLSDSTSQHIG